MGLPSHDGDLLKYIEQRRHEWIPPATTLISALSTSRSASISARSLGLVFVEVAIEATA